MGTYIHTDDLLDTTEIAQLVGWHSFRVVSQYRTRHPDRFPRPVVDKGPGRARLWARADVMAWLEAR